MKSTMLSITILCMLVTSLMVSSCQPALVAVDTGGDPMLLTHTVPPASETVVPPCPIPELSVSTTGYRFGDPEHPNDADIYLFFTTGLTEWPPSDCFTTGEDLYLDSRVDFSIPGGDVIISLPTDYVEGANLEIRDDLATCEPYKFGDAFEGYELDPDLSPILLANPVLDGYAKLCNREGVCDEILFTFAEGDLEDCE